MSAVRRPTTLKVDWDLNRIRAVHTALRLLGQWLPAELRPFRTAFAEYLDVDESGEYYDVDGIGATIKLRWTDAQLDAFDQALVRAIDLLEADALRARDNLPGPSYEDVVATQTQVHAALTDIRGYREAVQAVRDMTQEA